MRVQGIRRDLSYPRNSCLKRFTTAFDGPYEEVPYVHAFVVKFTACCWKGEVHTTAMGRVGQWSGRETSEPTLCTVLFFIRCIL